MKDFADQKIDIDSRVMFFSRVSDDVIIGRVIELNENMKHVTVFATGKSSDGRRMRPAAGERYSAPLERIVVLH